MSAHLAIQTTQNRASAPRSPEIAGWDQPHLVFMIDHQPYACPVTQIERLLRLPDATIHPKAENAPASEAARLEMPDGSEIPVISLRTQWSLPPLSDYADWTRQALLITAAAGEPFALLVDNCICVLSSLPSQEVRYRLPSALKKAAGAAFQYVLPWNKTLLVIIEMKALFSSASWAGLSPAAKLQALP
jgi:chemotaxis signal transduction protein